MSILDIKAPWEYKRAWGNWKKKRKGKKKIQTQATKKAKKRAQPRTQIRARIGYRLGWLLASNNGRCLALWIITGGLLVMSIFSGFGEPILTHTVEKKIFEIPQTEYHQSVYDAWYGLEKVEAETAGKNWLPAKEETPSLLWGWKWWLAFLLFLFISAIYTPIAFREEIKEVWEDTWIKIREKEETEAKEEKTKTGESASEPTVSGKETFAKQLGLEFAAEFLAEMVQKFVRRR